MTTKRPLQNPIATTRKLSPPIDPISGLVVVFSGCYGVIVVRGSTVVMMVVVFDYGDDRGWRPVVVVAVAANGVSRQWWSHFIERGKG